MIKKPLNLKLPFPYSTMTASDFEQETAKFDREFSGDSAQPLTLDQRQQHQRAKRGRSRIGKGKGREYPRQHGARPS